MPRQIRSLGKSSIYHVMVRGNERKQLFLDIDDKIRFIDTLQLKRKVSGFEIYAYCLMDNHVHLLLKEGNEGIAQVMKRINVSYAYYFNNKYKRIGHLFQDRFKSEAIENDGYLLEAVRYIHNNPVKAGIVKQASDYQWSSFNLYIKGDSKGVINRFMVLGMFLENENAAIPLFEEFNSGNNTFDFIEYDERDKKEKLIEEEREVKEIINRYLQDRNLNLEVLKNNREIRNQVILQLREQVDLSIRRIAEILKINRGVVQNLVKNCDKKNRPHCQEG